MKKKVILILKLLFFVLILFLLYRELKNYNIRHIIEVVNEYSISVIILGLLTAGLNYFILTFYDLLALRNEDEELITVPNKQMIGDILVNSFEFRVVESAIGVAYEGNPQKAIEIIKGVLDSFDEVSKEHKPVVGIAKFGDSAIELGLRYWVPTKSFFKTQYEVNFAIYTALHVNGITIPFPQREVRILGEKFDSKEV